MLSAKDIDILRSIARAGSDYDAIKKLLAETPWEIEEDEVDLGFLRIFIHIASGKCYRLIICYRDPDRPPYFLLTFAVLPEFEKHLTTFNAAFHSAGDALGRYFGAPAVSGDRQFSFRNWPYAYHRWSLPEGEFTLVQDEFDIQDGMDVTLWVQPVGTTIEETLHL